MTELEESNRHVLKGGRWKPSECYPQQKVAIIIPYRDRWQPLKLLLKRIHPMMQHQKLDYQILVVNQVTRLCPAHMDHVDQFFIVDKKWEWKLYCVRQHLFW